jgi:ParB family chromosome partitioning protein
VEPVPRTTAPAQATGLVEFVPLAAISAAADFRLRPEGDVTALAGSIARLGQLSPVELRPVPGGATAGGARYQVVAGFRRLAAVRLLARGRVLARVHARLDDEDAWALSLTAALLGEPLGPEALGALRDRLAALATAPWAAELVEEALVRAPVAPELRERFLAFLQGAPEGAPPGPVADDATQDAAGEAAAEAEPEPEAGAEPAPEEVTAEQLAETLATGLWSVSQDLDLAVDAWRDLPETGRRQILDQLRYLAELHAYLAGARR